jgi:hypothetical protein
MRWDAGQTIGTILPDLGHPAGALLDSGALAINNTGAAVGYATLFSGSGQSLGKRPAIWDPSGSIVQLGDWGSTSGFSTVNAYALAINDSGVIAGNDTTFFGHALRWNPGSTTPVVLAGLVSGLTPDTTAFGLNSQGVIVGSARASGNQHDAVYWNPDGSVVDLNSLIDPSSGWTLKIASAISDTGWILGVGSFDPDGSAGPQSAYDRLFILQAPEPSSLELAVESSVCVLGLIVIFRRLTAPGYSRPAAAAS